MISTRMGYLHMQLMPYPVFPGLCLNQQAKLNPFVPTMPLKPDSGMKTDVFWENSTEDRFDPGRLGPLNVAWPMLSRSSSVGEELPNGQVALQGVSKQFGAIDADVSAVNAQ